MHASKATFTKKYADCFRINKFRRGSGIYYIAGENGKFNSLVDHFCFQTPYIVTIYCLLNRCIFFFFGHSRHNWWWSSHAILCKIINQLLNSNKTKVSTLQLSQHCNNNDQQNFLWNLHLILLYETCNHMYAKYYSLNQRIQANHYSGWPDEPSRQFPCSSFRRPSCKLLMHFLEACTRFVQAMWVYPRGFTILIYLI